MAASVASSSDAPSAASTARSNALQNRITAVLSASYADLEIRDALNVLDERGWQNNAESRRNLRLDVQAELIKCNGEIVQDFGLVAKQLQRVGAAIASLDASCAEMRKHISAAQRETGPMLDEARAILREKENVETKRKLFDAFTAHFVVSEADLATLTSTAEPVNDSFFRILTRVKKIHEDSQVLLGSENQRLGLEILEQSSRHLNAAYQKLYRWVQREFKSLDLENPQLGFAIRRAVRVLAERPSLFQSCLDFFAESREQILSSNFYASLTGTPVDQDHPVMGKAIELSAHDPLRYISDMLAWAHSATVSEREALEILFIAEGDEIARNIQAGLETERLTDPEDPEQSGAPFDGRRALAELLDRVLVGVFRQLKQRSEQVVQSHDDALLAYKVSNLVGFYTTKLFSPLLNTMSSLIHEILDPLSNAAVAAFRSSMRDRVVTTKTDALALPPDANSLSPPDFLIDALETLHGLMQSFDSTSSGPTTISSRAEAFFPILDEALDPYLEICDLLATRLKSPPHAADVFTVNYLNAVHAVLVSQPFTSPRAETLQPYLSAREASLVNATYTWFLRTSSLSALIDTIATVDNLASSYRDPRALSDVARKIDAFLPTATEDVRAMDGGVLGRLQDPAMVRRVVEAAAERFVDEFERIEELVVEADKAKRRGLEEGVGENEDEEDDEEQVWLREIFPRTVDEIRVLLS
jgi:hypothetical protein